MKFNVDRDTFKTSLDCITKGMDMNSTIPILSGVLITAVDSYLTLEASNTEVSIKLRVPSVIEEEGSMVIPCRLLADIINHLPSLAVQFVLEGNTCKISCGKSLYSINTFTPHDFPAFPNIIVDKEVEIPTVSLNEMISRVAVAASSDKNRGILNGVYVTINEDTICFVTTDSTRLAVAQAHIATDINDFSVIAPSKTLRSVLMLAQDSKTITIGLNESQIIFKFNDIIYISRRIDGIYPAYKKLIPTTCLTTARLKMNDLYEAMQRIKPMTITNSSVNLQIDTDLSQLVIISNVPDQGYAREEVPIEAEGESLSISFNSRFIFDFIQKNESDDDIIFECDDPFKPGVFKVFGKIDFLYLMMPTNPRR